MATNRKALVYVGIFYLWGDCCDHIFDPEFLKTLTLTLKKYLLIHLGVALILAGGAFYPVWIKFDPDSVTAMYCGFGVAMLSSLLAFIIAFRGIERDVRKFMNYVVGGMLMKMMFGIGTIFIVALSFEKPIIRAYVISFFLSYLIFTSIEVWALMRKNASVK